MLYDATIGVTAVFLRITVVGRRRRLTFFLATLRGWPMRAATFRTRRRLDFKRVFEGDIRHRLPKVLRLELFAAVGDIPMIGRIPVVKVFKERFQAGSSSKILTNGVDSSWMP